MFIILSFLISFGAKYAGEFIDLPVGGRAQGLGGAYVTLVRGAESPFWNPSCIMIEEGKDLFLFHSENFGGLVNYNTLSFSMSDGIRGLGVALYHVGVPDIPLTNDSIILDTVNIDDWVIYLTYGSVTDLGGRVHNGISYGLNMKAIYRDWKDGSAYGIGIDGGLFYRFCPFSVGLHVENMTTTVLFWSTGTREFIAPLLKTGISYEFPVERLSGRFIIAGGLDTDLENKITRFDAIKSDPHIGAEYIYKERFAVRVGLDKGDMSFGAGIRFGSLKVDYGQSQNIELGTNSRFSLNFKL